jgi:hypothetical protein
MMKSTVVSLVISFKRSNIEYQILAHYKIRSNDQQQIEIEKSAKYTDLFVCPVNRSFIHYDLFDLLLIAWIYCH